MARTSRWTPKSNKIKVRSAQERVTTDLKMWIEKFKKSPIYCEHACPQNLLKDKAVLEARREGWLYILISDTIQFNLDELPEDLLQEEVFKRYIAENPERFRKKK